MPFTTSLRGAGRSELPHLICGWRIIGRSGDVETDLLSRRVAIIVDTLHTGHGRGAGASSKLLFANNIPSDIPNPFLHCVPLARMFRIRLDDHVEASILLFVVNYRQAQRWLLGNIRVYVWQGEVGGRIVRLIPMKHDFPNARSFPHNDIGTGTIYIEVIIPDGNVN